MNPANIQEFSLSLLKKSSDQQKNCTFAAFHANSRSEVKNCCVFAGLTAVQKRCRSTDYMQTRGPSVPFIQKTPPQPASAAEAQGAVPLCIDSDYAPAAPLQDLAAPMNIAIHLHCPVTRTTRRPLPVPKARSRTELPGATRQPRTGTTCSLQASAVLSAASCPVVLSVRFGMAGALPFNAFFG